MRDIEVKISKETRKVDLNQSFIGNDAENLQSNIVFSFKDDFVNGVASLEYSVLNEKRYAMLEKEGESYKIPIKSVLTKKGSIPMQLVITEPGEYVLTEDQKYLIAKKYFLKVEHTYKELIPGTDYEVGDDIVGDIYECINIPIFKSNVFYVYVNESINAEAIEPEEYYSWIVIANQKLIEIDEALEQVDNLDIDAQRVEDGVEVTITRKDGTTKTVKVNDGQGGSGGSSDYEELENKPQINGHELIGNQTSEELGIETYDDTEVWNAISEHDREIQNIGNDIEDLQSDIDDLGTELDNLDLNKQDKLVSGTNIKTINNQSILGSGNISIESGAVDSVNGKTGTVVLNAGDIKASNAQTIQQNLERIDERIDSLDSIAMIPESSTYISTGTTGSNYLKIMEVLNRYFSNKAGDTAQIFYNDELYSFKYTYLSSQTSDYVRVLVYFISQKNSMTQIKYGMSFKQAPKTLYLDVYVKPSEYSTQSITELFGNSSLSSNDIKFTIEPSSNLYYSVKGDFLGLNNTTAWTPTGDYQPSTKKYVDDSIAAAITDALGGNY